MFARSLKRPFDPSYSCSWGPNDNGQLAEGPPPLTYRAMLNGIKNGRGGLGSIYVFASGNGALYDDDCNYDGYANSIFGISIGAIDASNRQFPYSERCTALLGVTYTDLVSKCASGLCGVDC